MTENNKAVELMTGIQLMVNWFNDIDYEMLREQKHELLEVISKEESNTVEFEALMGILHLVDSLQDTAVEVGIRSKEEVFNLTEE